MGSHAYWGCIVYSLSLLLFDDSMALHHLVSRQGPIISAWIFDLLLPFAKLRTVYDDVQPRRSSTVDVQIHERSLDDTKDADHRLAKVLDIKEPLTLEWYLH
jgi:hypothetical protein